MISDVGPHHLKNIQKRMTSRLIQEWLSLQANVELNDWLP
jgi:hypothetical protein